jgi:hypothetical protein
VSANRATEKLHGKHTKRKILENENKKTDTQERERERERELNIPLYGIWILEWWI